jgi:Skp family chaperone for outer membrane proteins
MMRRGLQMGLLGTLIGVVAWCYGALHAGEHFKAAPKTRDIAVIDMVRVFNEYPRFREGRDALRRTIETEQERCDALAAEIGAMEDRLNGLDRSSADYRDLKGRIASSSAELRQLKSGLQRRLFQAESGLYEATYRTVRAEVQHFAEQNGISLVIRFTHEKDDESGKTDPQRTIAKLQAQVVYHAGLDITDEILAGLR